MACIVGSPSSLCCGCLFERNVLRYHGGRDIACRISRFRFSCQRVTNFRKEKDSAKLYRKPYEISNSDADAFSLIHVQTLRNYPREKLSGEVVAVRLDSSLILSLSVGDGFSSEALHTIKYLYDAGAVVLLLSDWDSSSHSGFSKDYFADHLSSLLQLRVLCTSGFHDIMQLKAEEKRDWDILLLENLNKFKEDVANCLDFSKKLSKGVGIFVNDAFNLAHKIYASTVGITRFCYSSVAGFHFERELNKLVTIAETSKRPYVAIIGGKMFIQKRAVLRLLVTKCDVLVFIGNLSFQIMHAMGVSVPATLVDNYAVDEAVDLVHLAKKKNTTIIFPDDLICTNDNNPEVIDVFPCDGIKPGWTPVDLGPISWENISCRLLNCQKVLLIGPMAFKAQEGVEAESPFHNILEMISSCGCEVVIVGNTKYKSSLSYTNFENASVVWEFLKGQTLPGVAALDRTFPFEVDWDTAFENPNLPLTVDVGSGNGLFLFGMARRCENENFLGLETNRRLVVRCQAEVQSCGMRNIHFLPANAASTFGSIISSYPGKLVLVSIQCPNPDFNKPNYRWKMVTRTLVEAVSDLLTPNGKVFLQSDIEEVAQKMKDDFLVYGDGVLVLEKNGDIEWIKENPFGVRSDWERHVLARGNPMFRVLLSKKSAMLEALHQYLSSILQLDPLIQKVQ